MTAIPNDKTWCHSKDYEAATVPSWKLHVKEAVHTFSLLWECQFYPFGISWPQGLATVTPSVIIPRTLQNNILCHHHQSWIKYVIN